MLRVHSIETFGTHEGPGIRFVLFLQGCQFRCVYCHNPDTWAIGAGGREIAINEIMRKIEGQKQYFQNNGGVTASGGEPLLQRKELADLFAVLKQKGIHTALDTNGSILDDDAKKLLHSTDLVLLDVKHIDPSWHKKVTGADITVSLQFAEYLEKHKKPFWLRYVLVPNWTDQEEHLHAWAEKFKDYRSIERVEILPYHEFGIYKYKELGMQYPLKDIKPPKPEQIHKALSIFKRYFSNVYVR